MSLDDPPEEPSDHPGSCAVMCWAPTSGRTQEVVCVELCGALIEITYGRAVIAVP
jgi:hypothetical protein